MKVSCKFSVQRFLDKNVIVPTEDRSWNTNALLILSDPQMLAYKRLSQGAEKEELISCLQTQLGIGEVKAEREVRHLLMRLEKNNLLEQE